MKAHLDDIRVKRGWVDGYCSHARYKLLEIDGRDRLFAPGMSVVDPGAAPGGWRQVDMTRARHQGQGSATDILEMDAIAGMDFIQGDFTEEGTLHAMLEALGNRQVNVVLSNMTPNANGQMAIDQL